MTYILTCCKTGRWWKLRDHDSCHRKARDVGLVDFTVEPLSPDPKPLVVSYRNWRGETRTRTLLPHSVWFGVTEWHPDPQWFLRAVDVETGKRRDFAMRDMSGDVT